MKRTKTSKVKRPALRKVGLTGGVAAGKSTVAKLLKQEGITVIDMDAIGRELTDESPTIMGQISKVVGKNVVTNGQLDRKAVREAVFADPKRKKDLENLLHPLIRREFEHRCDESFEAGQHIVICEAALLVESGHYKDLDELIVVTAPEAVRLERLMERDDIEEGLAKQIMQAQMNEETKVELATHTISNDGSEKELKAQLRPLLKQWKKEKLL